MSPNELARQLKISPDKVLTWIRNGELVATNVATTTIGRPRWHIDPADVETFTRRRRVSRPVYVHKCRGPRLKSVKDILRAIDND